MELLAPAGTFGCVKAAVNSGADAVYFAGQGFGARSFAGNLTDEEIFYAVDFCHLRGARAYITVNTLVYDREFGELEKFVKTITKAGADGVIVQDLGVMRFIKQVSPDIELHASTQMTVHSLGGVKKLENEGVSRVVLSRELSAAEIEFITKNASAETEVFVHGAMCMSYSGQCLMSSVIGGRSGNRGKCAQPCRLPYSADGRDEKFYLSLKDMSLARHLGRLEEMGVASLKIEGRMKGEGYVTAVVSAYRRLIDEKRQPKKCETEELNRVFYRGGLTDGYFTDKKGVDMFAFDKPDNPYLKNGSNIRSEVSERKQPINIYAEIFEGEPPLIKMECGDISVCVIGDAAAEHASKRPLSAEDVKMRICKMGDTAFSAENAEIKIKGEPFLAVSQINELRRRAAAQLEEKILLPYRNKRIKEPPKPLTKERAERNAVYTCSVLTIRQFEAARKYKFDRIYIPVSVAEKNADKLISERERIVLSLPVIVRGDERGKIRDSLLRLRTMGFDKAEISTLDGFELADGFQVYASHRMNITNSLAFNKLCEMGVGCCCLSPELNIGIMRGIIKNSVCEVIAYGRIPLMITENCILKNIGKCPCKNGGYVTDRKGTKFPIVKDGDKCRSVVLNSVPLYMADKGEELDKIGADYLRLMFTTEDKKRVGEVCDAYLNGSAPNNLDFTRLRMFKSATE